MYDLNSKDYGHKVAQLQVLAKPLVMIIMLHTKLFSDSFTYDCRIIKTGFPIAIGQRVSAARFSLVTLQSLNSLP
jgi:hypothetical protein